MCVCVCVSERVLVTVCLDVCKSKMKGPTTGTQNINDFSKGIVFFKSC